ncbi:MAG: hypothetical protein RL660_3199 [Bacteroidota bacterium]|jgi:hypothetical protein
MLYRNKNALVLNMFLLCQICLLFACRQNLPPVPVAPDPVFGVVATLNTDSLKLFAGVDSNYMHATYYTDNARRTVLKGVIGKENCDTCGDFVSVLLYPNDFIEPNYAYNASQLLSGSNFNSFSLDTIKPAVETTLNCLPHTVVTASVVSWEDDFGSMSNSGSPSFIYTNNGWTNISMNYVLDGQSYTTTNAYKLSSTTNFGQVRFTASTANWTITANYSGPGKVVWLWGDGSSTSNSSMVTHTYANIQVPYVLKAILVKGSDSSIVSQRIDFLSTQIVHPGFDFTAQKVQPPYANNARAAIIEIAHNGKHYRSYKSSSQLSQSNRPVLSLNTVKDALPTPTGLKAKILDIGADVYLYNTANEADSVRFLTSKMIIGVGVPQ